MKKNKNPLNAKEQEWLLTTAWKQFTLTQIAERLGRPSSSILLVLNRNGLKAMTKADFAAKCVLELYQQGTPMHARKIAKQLGCSSYLVKEIMKQYSIEEGSIKRSPASGEKQEPVYAKPGVLTPKEQKNRLNEMENRSKEIKAMRAKFTVYNQTGSELLDELRGIKTTKREKTLLTSAK